MVAWSEIEFPCLPGPTIARKFSEHAHRRDGFRTSFQSAGVCVCEKQPKPTRARRASLTTFRPGCNDRRRPLLKAPMRLMNASMGLGITLSQFTGSSKGLELIISISHGPFFPCHQESRGRVLVKAKSIPIQKQLRFVPGSVGPCPGFASITSCLAL